MKRIFSVFILILFLLTALPSCSVPKSAFENDGRVKIVATLFPQYDFVRAVGGERVQAVKLLPAGTESHTYEPTASDIVTIADADLFVYTGPDMEPWAQTILDGLDTCAEALDLSSVLHLPAPQDSHSDHDHAGVADPHIWTNPKNAMVMVQAICDALSSLDPEGEEVYRANSEAYLASLSALDLDLRAIAEQAENKTLVFGGRFAFAHLCEAYGFSHISAYRGCDVQAEPSATDIAAVIDFVRTNGISFVFKEEYVSSQSLKTIVQETGAAPLLLHSCHNLTKEDLEKGETYLSLMQKNVEALRLALLGSE